MNKKINSIAIVLLIILASIALMKKDEILDTKNDSLEQSKTYIENSFKHSTSNEKLTDDSDKKNVSNEPNAINRNIVNLIDKNIPAIDKINYIKNLDLSSLNDENSKILIDYIISENPYSAEEIKPHTVEEMKMNHEGAVRIYALRRLHDDIPLDEFKKIAEFISDNSRDDTIVSVVKQAIEARSIGQNYFENVIKAAEQMKLPEYKSQNNESHNEHDGHGH